MIDDLLLSNEVGRLLCKFYEKRIDTLKKLNLTKLLNKNPYLYRSLGVNDASNWLQQVLVAFVSSSDETIFGNDFFEKLAVWSAREADEFPGGKRMVNDASGAGIDISIEGASFYQAISVKSGKNIFNSQSDKGQSAEFSQLQARMKKLGKQFLPVIGYGYGRKIATKNSNVDKVAGQNFWKLLTGEHDFYLKISRAIGNHSGEHFAAYQIEFDATKNRLLRELLIDYSDLSGTLNWEKIVEFNSCATKPRKTKIEVA